VPTPIEQLRDAIAAAQTVVISGHKGPDGDCIGAALALRHGLKSLGKDVTVLSNDEVPKIVRFLDPGSNVIHLATESDAEKAGNGHWDLGILVDVGFTQRAGRAEPALLAAERLAVVDHHEVGPEVSGEIRIIDPSASATCFILSKIFREIGLPLDKNAATCLLTGIVTDTGSFRFRNTDEASLSQASELISLGADLPRISEEVWDSRPMAAITLLRKALFNLELLAENRLAVTHLGPEDFGEAKDEDSEGIASEIARIDGVLVAASFREPLPDRVRVSVRSRGDIDIAEVCRKFGGGGHKNAAGCTLSVDVHSAMQRVLPELEKCLESS
jgi:phosphoesterase RecJ-like protein